MARAIWTGSITFGLVTIPVKLVTAVRESEGIHFHYLHAKDEGRIHETRTCEVDGKSVPWAEVIRGYEYAKGKYVTITDDELKKMRPEATQTVEIREFVDFTEVDPMLFDKPYWLEPEKKGRHAYALLRDALRETGKVGIAEVVLRSRQYLAAVKPSGDGLVLEMMHFENELVNPKTLDLPPAKQKPSEAEMKAARMFIDAMSKKFDAGEFKDTYRAELKKMLDARASGKHPKATPAAKAPKATNVIDLVSVLEKSLAQAGRGGRGARPSRRAPSRSNHKSAHRKAS